MTSCVMSNDQMQQLNYHNDDRQVTKCSQIQNLQIKLTKCNKIQNLQVDLINQTTTKLAINVNT